MYTTECRNSVSGDRNESNPTGCVPTLWHGGLISTPRVRGAVVECVKTFPFGYRYYITIGGNC